MRLFPFPEWRASAGLRDLTHKEQTRLSEIRRTLLARLYAERTRQRKKRQSANHKTTLQALLEENAQLKHVVAEYEQITRELEQQVEQLGRANTHLTH
jgi:predicted RNase H-like nuclease (RuvC/YqgF family)